MARRTPEGPPPEPVAQRLRVRYAKRGRMRFSSTRDFQRALERAVRRAGLPMAFSAGFHPHPRISYANAAPTGVASEAEYVELGLTRPVDPAEVAPVLDRALPDGLDVVAVTEAHEGALADRLEASRWSLVFRGADGAGVRSALRAFLAADRVEVTRMMKQGPRVLDVREPVLAAQVDEGPDGPVVTATVRHTTPTVRPEELWHALTQVGPQDLPRPLATRLAQGPLGGSGDVGDPLQG